MNNRRSYIVFLTIQGADSLFFALITTINLVYQVQMVHLDPLQLVLVGTALETSCFIVQVPTGIFADIYSRRWSVIIGFLLVGIGFTLEGSFPTFAIVLISQVIWGVGSSFVSGALEAWVADEVGEEHIGPVFIRGTQVGQLTALVGIIASVVIASIQINYSIIAGGVLYVGMGIFLLMVMPEHRRQAREKSEHPGWKEFAHTALEGGRLVRRSRTLLIITAIAAFFGMSSEGMDRLWISHLLTDIHVPTLGILKPVVWFGVIEVVSMGLAVIATGFMRKWINTREHKAVVLWQLLFNALRVTCMLLFAFTGNFLVALLALWGASLTRKINHPLYDAWLAQNIDPKVRATVMSFNGQVDACGQILGGPAIGWIGNYSLRGALALTTVLLAPVLPLYAWSAHKGVQSPDSDKKEEGPLVEVPS